jgi:hypothetical protein
MYQVFSPKELARTWDEHVSVGFESMAPHYLADIISSTHVPSSQTSRPSPLGACGPSWANGQTHLLTVLNGSMDVASVHAGTAHGRTGPSTSVAVTAGRAHTQLFRTTTSASCVGTGRHRLPLVSRRLGGCIGRGRYVLGFVTREWSGCTLTHDAGGECG